MVFKAGIEPARSRGQQILSLSCIPDFTTLACRSILLLRYVFLKDFYFVSLPPLWIESFLMIPFHNGVCIRLFFKTGGLSALLELVRISPVFGHYFSSKEWKLGFDSSIFGFSSQQPYY